MARTTVRMPFSGSTRPTMPTIGSSGRLLSRALHPASGGPGWNRSGSTAWGMMRRWRWAGPTVSATARLMATVLDASRIADRSTTRPSPGRTRSWSSSTTGRRASRPARAQSRCPHRLFEWTTSTFRARLRQPPGIPAGHDHLVPQRPHARTSVTGRPQPEAGRGRRTPRARTLTPTTPRPGDRAATPASAQCHARRAGAPGRAGCVPLPIPGAKSRRRGRAPCGPDRDRAAAHSRSSLHSRPHGRPVTPCVAHHATERDAL